MPIDFSLIQANYVIVDMEVPATDEAPAGKKAPRLLLQGALIDQWVAVRIIDLDGAWGQKCFIVRIVLLAYRWLIAVKVTVKIDGQERSLYLNINSLMKHVAITTHEIASANIKNSLENKIRSRVIESSIFHFKTRFFSPSNQGELEVSQLHEVRHSNMIHEVLTCALYNFLEKGVAKQTRSSKDEYLNRVVRLVKVNKSPTLFTLKLADPDAPKTPKRVQKVIIEEEIEPAPPIIPSEEPPALPLISLRQWLQSNPSKEQIVECIKELLTEFAFENKIHCRIDIEHCFVIQEDDLVICRITGWEDAIDMASIEPMRSFESRFAEIADQLPEEETAVSTAAEKILEEMNNEVAERKMTEFVQQDAMRISISRFGKVLEEICTTSNLSKDEYPDIFHYIARMVDGDMTMEELEQCANSALNSDSDQDTEES